MLGRSLLIKASNAGRLLLYPAYVHEVLDRITNADVVAGNTLGLELAVTDAFSNCLQALVADGILGVSGGVLAQAASLMKASCFMMGARTLSGALVPLAADMPAPTNINFVAGDYSRRTGLGDPNNATKQLISNRAGNADPRDNAHIAVYVTQRNKVVGVNQFLIGVSGGNPGSFHLVDRDSDSVQRVRSATLTTGGPIISTPTLFGASRFSSSQYIRRINGTSTTINQASDGSLAESTQIFNASSPFPVTSRICFYTIGEALDLAILDARVTALSNAIQAAIAP